MSELTKEEINEAAKAPQNKKKKLIPSWAFLILIVGVILGARKYFYEPFKIPSGSMEPTLIGHPDYGDRILTEKFWDPRTADPDRFDIVVFEHNSEWNGVPKRAAVKKNYIKRLIGKPKETIILSGGELFLMEDGKTRILRKWDEADGGSVRLQENLWHPVSLASFKELPVPADVKPSDKTGEFEKWMAARRAAQENNRAFPWEVQSTKVESSGAEATAKAQYKRFENSVEVEGALTLSYKHDIENVYVKMGRWPFRCINCPAHQRAVADKTVRHPDAPNSEYVLPYVPNTWGGVECPNCKQLKFPPSRFDNSVAGSPRLVPVRHIRGLSAEMRDDIVNHKLANKSIEQQDLEEYLKKHKFEQLENEPNPSGMEQLRFEKPMLTPKYLSASEPFDSSTFFCGGYNKVGDLKLVVELEVLNADGSLQLEVGSNFHKAIWPISLGGKTPEPKEDEQNHVVKDYIHELSQGEKVILTLTYIDGTVRAGVDGDIRFVKKIDVAPLGKDELKLKSHLALKFGGNPRVRITRLEIYRDLYHTLFNDSSGFSATVGPVNRPAFPEGVGYTVREDRSLLGKYDPETRTYTFKIPDGHYLMMGDNSPSSQDGRNWGYVPQESLIGRALLTWWPPSRWGTLE